MKLEFSVNYDHPIELVFHYLSEPDTWHEWVPAVMERTQITEGPVGVGTKWKAVDRAGPFRFRFTDELVELAPNERILFQHHPVNAETEYRVEKIGDKTVAHVRFEGDLKGSMRWLDLMPDWIASRIFRSDLERLGPFLDQKGDS